MSETTPVGIFIATATPPGRIAPLAASAERAGFAEVWVAEDYFCHGGFSAAAIALGATREVTVGLGVVAAVVRHPAATAMEIATLARAFPGRFRPGIGHGLGAWTDQMNLTARSPLTALRECVTGVQSLLAGQTLDAGGKEFTFRSVQLTHPVDARTPVLTGVLGPKSLELSGEIADGTVVSIMAGPQYLKTARTHIQTGMDKSGRTEHLLPTFAMLSIDTDGAAAKAAMRPVLGFFLATVGAHNSLTQPYGYNEHLAYLIDKGGPQAVAEGMPDEWIDELTLSGDPDEVGAGIERLLAAGATSVMISPVNATTAQAELDLVAGTVLPVLRPAG